MRMFGFLWIALASFTLAQDPLPEFEDVTEKMGLAGVGGCKYSWGDFNNDGFQDLLLEGVGLFKNVDGKKFENVTDKAKLAGSCFGIWGDYDNDGFIDIASTAANVWHNNGDGTFTDVTHKANVIMNRPCGLTWADINGDGWLDLYVGTSEDWNNGNPKYYQHQLFINKRDGTFEDASERYRVNKWKTYGRSIVACDFDEDGDQELYVGNYRLTANRLLKLQDASLVDISKEKGVRGLFDQEMHEDKQSGKKYGPQFGHTIGCAWADFNNDGYFDLWSSNLVHKYVGPSQGGYDIRGYVCDDSNIFINQGPPDWNFVDVRGKCGIPPRPIGGQGVYTGDELWAGVACADFDNDGFVDAFIPQIYNLDYANTLMYRNNGDLTFTEVGKKLGIRLIDTYGGAWGDFDNDGNMDLATGGREKVDGKPQMHLYRNKGSGKSWVEFKLVGSKSNRCAIGAVVTVTAGGKKMVRQVEGSTGSHSQQNMMTLHFGLGGAKEIDSVSIRWPSGANTLVEHPKINNINTAKE